MRKILKTVRLLFWGNLAFIAINLYIALIVTVGVTQAFYAALMEIWTND